jgi:hypothetical protein
MNKKLMTVGIAVAFLVGGGATAAAASPSPQKAPQGPSGIDLTVVQVTATGNSSGTVPVPTAMCPSSYPYVAGGSATENGSAIPSAVHVPTAGEETGTDNGWYAPGAATMSSNTTATVTAICAK